MSAIAIKNQGLFKTFDDRKVKTRDKNTSLVLEERDIIQALEDLKRELSILYSQFNYITDPSLIDGCIYDIKAANAKYTFYLNKCKERRIKAVV